MSNELTQPGDESKIAKLKQLALAANEAHNRVVEAARHAVFHSYQAGVALVEAQKLCEPRRWLKWLDEHFQPSARTAQRYMEFALDCHGIGALDAERVSRMPPQEANRVLTKLLAVRDAKKKPKAAPSSAPAAQASAAAVENLPGQTVAARQTVSPPHVSSGAAATNPYLRLKSLFEELMEGLRVVMNGEGFHDGPFAELMLIDLKPVYDELLEYLKDRDYLHKKLPVH
jgi:hypothetical protein